MSLSRVDEAVGTAGLIQALAIHQAKLLDHNLHDTTQACEKLERLLLVYMNDILRVQQHGTT